MNKYKYNLQLVDKMIVIAAPSCCGKSAFIEKLNGGEEKLSLHRVQVRKLDCWMFVNANEVSQIKDERVPQMFLHYAIPSLPLTSGLLGDIADDRGVPALIGLGLELVCAIFS